MAISGQNILPDSAPPANPIPRISRDTKLRGELADRIDAALLGTLNYLTSPKRAGSLYVTSGSLTAQATPTAGGCFSVANPTGTTAMVITCVVDVTTQSTSASSLDVGVAANGTTSADTLLDGASVAAAKTLDNIANAGTNGGMDRAAATEYVTATSSADASGLVGTYHIVWLVPAA